MPALAGGKPVGDTLPTPAAGNIRSQRPITSRRLCGIPGQCGLRQSLIQSGARQAAANCLLSGRFVRALHRALHRSQSA
jgi:hypothetical protein